VIQGEHKFCFAVGCNTMVPRLHLMCPMHWSQVPRDLRQAVETTFAAWQAGGTPHPYVIAIRRARAAVETGQKRAEAVANGPDFDAWWARQSRETKARIYAGNRSIPVEGIVR